MSAVAALWKSSVLAQAVLFVLAGNVEALGARHCLHHHAPHAAAATAPSNGHRLHHHGVVPDPAAQQDTPEGTSCTCLGTCHSGAAASLPVATPRLLPALESRLVAYATQPGVIAPTRDSYAIPYAHGPPLAPSRLAA
jgi:hypothetical protein